MNIDNAVKIVKQGGVIICPTDTVHGIACRIDNKNAVDRLFKIKQRSQTQAVPVLVDGIEMVKEYVEEIPDDVLELMKKYWPGGLTIVLPCKTDKVLESIRGGGSTIGVRQPNSKILQELIQKVDVPITGTSANFHGKKTPTKQSELEPELIKLVDLVIPGDSGMQQASTILDCSVKPWKILRQGAIVL